MSGLKLLIRSSALLGILNNMERERDEWIPSRLIVLAICLNPLSVLVPI